MRALLLTPEREVLLLRIHAPGSQDFFWIAPGGGMEPGESSETCLSRELKEELGLSRFEMGPLLWRRQHTFNWGEKRICQREQYRAVHVPRFEPHMTDAIERESLDRFRWWLLTELASASEPLTPLSLATLLERYVTCGAPTEPPPWEILVD